MLNSRTIALINAKMIDKGAIDLSDKEIARCFEKTCAPRINIKRAKYLRDLGLLKIKY